MSRSQGRHRRSSGHDWLRVRPGTRSSSGGGASGGGGGVSVLMAYHQDWPAWAPTDAAPFNSRTGTDATGLGGGYRVTAGSEISDGTNAYYWDYNFSTDAGTFTLTYLSTKYFEYGKFDVRIDGTIVGTIDLYAGGASYNVVTTLAGIALSAGNHVLRFESNGKNASATSYVWAANYLSLTRTGA